jgi:threonine dehydrogenase-like Zn-dependent dehydrogenase
VQGGQSELVRVPLADGTLERVPEALAGDEFDHRVLPLGDVFSTGYHAMAGTRPEPGDTVLVIGDGAVGLMACHAARLFGPASIVLAGHHGDRLDLGHRLGATHSVEGEGADMRALLAELTDGRGPDVVVASVCHPDVMRTACEVARPGGRIGWVGMEVLFEFPEVPWDVAWFKNLTLTGGVCPARRYIHRLWPLLEQGRIEPSPVFTHTVGLEEVPAAYAAMAAREPGWVKVAVRP